jgi:hypothetical protein
MKTQFIAAVLVALSATAAAPAFATGNGPAPFYRPTVGAPASQSGPSARTVANERDDAAGSQEGYGGVASSLSQSGSHVIVTARDNLFAHH